MSQFGIMGNECVGVTFDGKRVLLEEMNEWGGFLFVEEAVDWAITQMKDNLIRETYEKIEVYHLKNGKPRLHVTIRGKD